MCDQTHVSERFVLWQDDVKLSELPSGAYGLYRSFLQEVERIENSVEVNSGRMESGLRVIVSLSCFESEGNKLKEIFVNGCYCWDANWFIRWNPPKAQLANAPILYQYGAFRKTLGQKYGQAEPALRNREQYYFTQTISDCMKWRQVFMAPNWGANPEAKQFTITPSSRIWRNGSKNGQTNAWLPLLDLFDAVKLDRRFCRLDLEAGRSSGYHR